MIEANRVREGTVMFKMEKVVKKYGKVMALDHVSIQMECKNYGLLGSNGAGKTTLIRFLAGILSMDSGKITYYNKDQKEISRKDYTIGYMPQTFEAIKEFTVKEQMEYFACLKKIPKSAQKEEILEALTLVHLEEQIGVKCKKLSGGMMQRLGIAQALLGKPDLILFDEPTTGLDPEERLRFKRVMRHLEGTCTVILSTHIVEDMESVCSDIVVLKDGRKEYDGSAVELEQMAEGKVFKIPDRTRNKMNENYFEIRNDMDNYKRYARVLYLGDMPIQKENQLNEAEETEPSLEDGYMYLIKNKK